MSFSKLARERASSSKSRAKAGESISRKLLGGRNWEGMVHRAREMVVEGKTRREIAHSLAVSEPTITNWFCKQGWTDELSGRMHLNASQAKSKNSTKVTREDVDCMVVFSTEGRGIDWIGNHLGLHGTTVRNHLIARLGEEEYKKRHSVERYSSLWPGRWHKTKYGDVVQSSFEETASVWLRESNIAFDLHKRVCISDVILYPDIYLPEQNIYVEICGLEDRKFYLKRLEIKKSLYREAGIVVKYIYPSKGDICSQLRRVIRNEG